jgi:hypothetical protein
MMVMRKCQEILLHSLKNFNQWLPQISSKSPTIITYKNLFWLDLLMLVIKHQLTEPPTSIHIHQMADWDNWTQSMGQQSMFKRTSFDYVYIYTPLSAKMVESINQISQDEAATLLIQDSNMGKHAKNIKINQQISAQPIYGQDLQALLIYLYKNLLKHPPTLKLKQEIAHHIRLQNHTASSLIHLLNALDSSVDSLDSILQPSTNWPMYACVDCMVFGDVAGLKRQLPSSITLPETHQLFNRCLSSISELIDVIEIINQDPAKKSAEIKKVAKWPTRISKYTQAIKRIPLIQLKKYYLSLMEIEYQLKGVKTGDPWHMLSLFMLQFADHRSSSHS